MKGECYYSFSPDSGEEGRQGKLHAEKRTLHPLPSNGQLDRDTQFERYPMQSVNRLFKYLVSLWWSELWRGSELGQTLSKGKQHTTQRVAVSSWEKSVSTETQCATGKFCVSQHCPEFRKTISHLPCFNISHFLVDWRSSPAGFTSTTASIFSLLQLTIVKTMAVYWGCRYGRCTVLEGPTQTSLNLSPECQQL